MTIQTAADLHCLPLYATPRTPSRPTLGPSVAKIAEMMGRPLKAHQRLIADVAFEINPATGYLAYSEVDIIINRQQGKALDVDTPILTPNGGWVTMGDLTAGDQVWSPNGVPTEVLAVSEVMDNRECFVVRTDGGGEVVADGEHLWTVFDRRVRRERIVTTVQLMADGIRRGDALRFRLPHQAMVTDRSDPDGMRRPLLPVAQEIVSIGPAGRRDVQCIKVDSPDGLYLAGRDLVPTHNSELSFPVMVHRCTGFDAALARWVRRELGHDVVEPGPQRVLYTAQRAEDARAKWSDIHVKRLEAAGSPFRNKVSVRRRLAAEAIRWPNGSSWSPGSATKKSGGTGDTLDLGVIDEAWSQKDNSTELAMRPTMLTRKWSQLWVMSMIPGLSRAAPGTWPFLHQKRQNGRARVQAGMNRGVAYFEWGMREGRDPADPATWWETMPGLAAGMVTEDAIRDDFEAMDLVDFMAEYLSVEPTSRAARWHLIGETTWRNLAVPAVRGRYIDPIALGVDAALDQSVASIGMAALDLNGDTYVELVARQPGLNWLVPALVDLADRMGPCAIGVAAHGPAAAIIEPLRRALLDANVDTELIAMQGPQVGQSCVQLFMETGELGDGNEANPDRRVRHPDDPELNAAVAAATKYTWADEWRFARSGEGGEISALYAVTLARGAGEAVEWLGGSYDLADSLG